MLKELLQAGMWIALAVMALAEVLLIWHSYAAGKEKDPDDQHLRGRWIEESVRWMARAYVAMLVMGVLMIAVTCCSVAPEATTTAPTAQLIRVEHQPTKSVKIPEVPRLGESDVPVPDTAHKLGTGTVTFYCTERYPHICGNGTGLTATGTEVTAGRTCAVDPDVIPLGSNVAIWYDSGEIVRYVAEDTGDCVTGNHVDVAVSSHDKALELGRKTAREIWWWKGGQDDQ